MEKLIMFPIFYSLVILAIILIFGIVLKKGLAFPRLAKIHNFSKYAILYIFIFICSMAILHFIAIQIKQYIQIEISDIWLILSSIILSVIIGKKISTHKV